MELLDSHAHYNDEKFDEDRKETIESIYNSGVTTIINAGYSLESSKKAIEIANSYPFIYATVGVSPNDIEGLNSNYIEQIEKLANNKKVVAIGEIGLDYYWNKENKEEQKEIFIKQIYRIKDIRAKSLGSSNAGNVANATLQALKELKTVEQVAKLRGLSKEEVLG